MTETAKPPTPLVTRVVQLFGLAAVGFGGWAIASGPGCQELGCLVWVLGIYLALWGVVAWLAGIRGPIGLIFLVGAILMALAASWVEPLYGIVFLGVVSLLIGASKERLAPYYRRRARESAT
jgi:hypothetical protein